MTINIGLVTSDAVVLACDSVASTTSYFLDPIALQWARDADGKWAKDADGKFSLKFDFDDYQSIVTNAWGGVTKMLPLHKGESPVVAVTAGLAKIKGRPIASLAGEFFEKSEKRKRKCVNVDVICKEFLEFIRAKYDEHYKDSSLPEVLREGPEFLVGGFGRDDEFPSLYRISVREKKVKAELGQPVPQTRTGVSWNGQSDAVERFIRGYAYEARRHVERTVAAELKTHGGIVAKYVSDEINGLMGKIGQPIPPDFKLEIPELKEIKVDWSQFVVDIDYANLPIQEAVKFASFLVLVQERLIPLSQVVRFRRPRWV
ncbi:MAG: hypothetical protein WEB85_14415, partial [Dongiaceae bacterium]